MSGDIPLLHPVSLWVRRNNFTLLAAQQTVMQARSQAMNTVSAAASNAYTYILSYSM
jgi:hypothetical protein